MKKQETKKLQQEENTNNKQNNLSFKFELKMLQQQKKITLLGEETKESENTNLESLGINQGLWSWAGGTRKDEMLWQQDKGWQGLCNTWGGLTQVETIRDQGRRQTSDTRGRESDLNKRGVTFQNKKWNSQDKKTQDKTPLTGVWHNGIKHLTSLCWQDSGALLTLTVSLLGNG